LPTLLYQFNEQPEYSFLFRQPAAQAKKKKKKINSQ